MSDNAILTQLLKAREELLDLSARNRLLNIPKRAAQWGAKIVDTVAEEVFANLVERRKRLKFIPLASENAQNEDEDEDQEQEQEDGDVDEMVPPPVIFSSISEDLPVRLDPEKLEKKLLKLQYDARTFEEEQGVNILYLAIGTLKWFEATHSEIPRFAPLILVPVQLDRSTIRSKFGLSWTEEEIATNLTLKAKLKSEFGLTLPEIEEDEDLNVRDYLDRVQQVVQDKPEWEVRSDDILLWFFSFSKFLMYRDLDPENWPEGNRLDDHPLIRSLVTEGFRGEPPICGDHDPIDEIIAPSEMVHVMDADSSQSVVVEEVKRNRNLVVQGPPGTGKSQTITNIIASAVTLGQKVLFVSEKMAALEVVKSRFEKLGLGDVCLELHSHKTNKKSVLEDLSRTLNLGAPKHADFLRQAEELGAVRDRLNRHARILHEKLDPAALSPFEVMGRLTRLQSRGVQYSDLVSPEATRWTAARFRAIRNQLEEIVRHVKQTGTPVDHVWRGVHLDAPPLPTDLQRYLTAITEIIANLDPLIDSLEKLKNSLNINRNISFSDSIKMLQVAQHLASAPQMDLKAISHVIWDEHSTEILELIEHGKSASELQSELASHFAEVAWSTDVSAIRRDIAAHGRSIFRFFNGAYRKALANYRGIVSDSLPETHVERLDLLDKLIQAQKQIRKINEDRRLQKIGETAFGTYWREFESDWGQLSSIADWERKGREIKSGLNLRHLLKDLNGQDLEGAQVRFIHAQLNPVYSQINKIFEALNLDLVQAFGVEALKRVPLESLKNRFNSWKEHTEDLSKWVQYDIRLKGLKSEQLDVIADSIDQGSVNIDNLVDRFEISYFEVLMRSILKAHPELAQFDGMGHEHLIAKFKELDLERIKLARLEVAKAHYENLPHSAGDFGEVGLIRREIAKKRKQLPIRRLLKEAGRAIQSIKPVFMMSPISIAQFLEAGDLAFDLLVIDEASQVKPVDALGAIARCRQIVVVGDDKQLPPTGFFDKIVSGDDGDDEETFQAGDVESILGLCVGQSMPSRMLEWHYRSRHQSLITVSNHEFYGNRLFIVPSPSTAGNEGLVFRHVPNGIYDRGGTRTNAVEAKEVAKAVMRHAETTPKLSLGVGTFSVAQRDAVLAEIELLRKDNPAFEEFFGTGHNEPFFVKNLENIQGDERDVIFISVGYGKDNSGFMSMSFGPLSMDGGERRLNVLITRARERCEVFSSITADDIDLARTNSFGTKSFKTFLKYAQHGHLDIGVMTGREFDSEFEEEVARSLENAGYEVHPQVGVAGFRIDLAIVDPEYRGRYLIGIECDGAAYHSSRSARDRDRLRQAVLEDRGWIIHRIWSSDWFHRPQEQLKKTMEAIESARRKLAEDNHKPEADRESDSIEESPQTIERSEKTNNDEDVASTSIAVAYEEAYFDLNSVIDWHGEDIHELEIKKLSRVVVKIIEIEGPIHRDELPRRTATLWGMKRTGKRIVDAVSAAERIAVRQGLVDLEGNFLDSPSRAEPRIRNRETVASSNLRKPEYLPSSEIEAAVIALVRSHFGILKEEAVTATARLFGFRTTSQQLREMIEQSILSLVSANRLVLNDNKLNSE